MEKRRCLTVLRIGVVVLVSLTLSSCCAIFSGLDACDDDESGTDRVEELHQETMAIADQFLSGESLVVLNDALAGASEAELEGIKSDLHAYVDVAEDYYAEHIQPRTSQSQLSSSDVVTGSGIFIVDENYSISNGIENLKQVLLEASDRVELGPALEQAGCGYSSELIVQAGGAVVLSGSVGSVAVDMSGGEGDGRAYDFLNMKRYDYTTVVGGGGFTVDLGPGVELPVSASYTVSGGALTSLVFNHEIDQSYTDSVSVSDTYTLGIGADIVAGLGVAGGVSWSQEIDTPWTPEDQPQEPTGSPSGETSLGILVELSLSGGTEIGVEGSFSGEIGFVYATPDPDSVYSYIPSREISRMQAIRASLRMSRDLLLGAPGGIAPMVASGMAIIYGLFMEIDEPEPETPVTDDPPTGNDDAAQTLIDIGAFAFWDYKNNYIYDGVLQIIGFHFLSDGTYRGLMYDVYTDSVKYYANNSAEWYVENDVIYVGRSSSGFYDSGGTVSDYSSALADGDIVQVNVNGTYYPSVIESPSIQRSEGLLRPLVDVE